MDIKSLEEFAKTITEAIKHIKSAMDLYGKAMKTITSTNEEQLKILNLLTTRILNLSNRIDTIEELLTDVSKKYENRKGNKKEN